MAHADYNCCAVCDSKLEYSNDADTKGRLCSFCLKSLRDLGLSILDTYELIKWIETNETTVVEDILRKAGFRFCFYSNAVDAAVELKGIKPEEKTRLVALTQSELRRIAMSAIINPDYSNTITKPTVEKVDLREKIAVKGANANFNLWDRLSQEEKDNWLNWADRILAIIKVAGWIDPATVIMPGEFGTPKNKELLHEWAIANGYKDGKEKNMDIMEILGKGVPCTDGKIHWIVDGGKRRLSNQILVLNKKAGCIKLVEDQSFSHDMTGVNISPSDCQHCFEARWKAGWRKVELEVKDE